MKSPRLFAARSARRQRGVTLVEAAVVLVVSVILATTAAPALQGLIDARRLDGAATQLATDIQFARTETVARNLPLRLSFHARAAGSCYVIHTGAAAQCRCGAIGAAQCEGDAREIKTVLLDDAERVSVQANVASVLFDPTHGTVSPTATVQVTGAGNRSVRHVINIVGRVRSCAPQAAVPGYRAC